jgi:hypothetical protein
MKPTISCVLLGGLGNQLFQISAVLAYAKERNLKYNFGFWDLDTTDLPFNKKDISPWGGHSLKNFKSLKEVFANLGCSDKKKFKFEIDRKYLYACNVSANFLKIDIKYSCRILGYFFSYKYWHHQRDYILKMLEPSPEIVKYIYDKYYSLFEQKTVSIHMRLGHLEDNGQVLPIFENFYPRAFKYFNQNEKYLIFTDNISKFNDIYLENFKKYTNSEFIVIDEDVYIVLFMMAMCDHHILHDSTLSFWGAYLDNKQPNETKTIYSENTVIDKVIPLEYQKKWIKIEYS